MEDNYEDTDDPFPEEDYCPPGDKPGTCDLCHGNTYNTQMCTNCAKELKELLTENILDRYDHAEYHDPKIREDFIRNYNKHKKTTKLTQP